MNKKKNRPSATNRRNSKSLDLHGFRKVYGEGLSDEEIILTIRAIQQESAETDFTTLRQVLSEQEIPFVTGRDACGQKITVEKEGKDYVLRLPGSGPIWRYTESAFISMFNNRLRVAPSVAVPEREVDQPPKVAEYLAYFFLPKKDRETLLGDLTEEYASVVEKFGQRAAQIHFFKHVLASIWPLVRKAVIKWAAFGWVVEMIKRFS